MSPTDPLPQQIAALRQRLEAARQQTTASPETPFFDELATALDGLHAAAVAQAEAVRRATAELEDRVRQRTAQLSLANEQLEHKIAEGKQTLEALRDSEARFHAAAEGNPDAFYILQSERDANGNIVDFTCTYLNTNAERRLSPPREKSLGRRLLVAHPESGRPGGFFDMAVRVVQTREALQAEFPVTNPSIRASWLHLTVVPLADGVAVTARDISERTHLEEQFRQAQKMAAVGQLAGGIAHHFNNLLTVVNGYCDLLRDSLLPGSPARGYVNEIHEAGRRAADLTQQLLTFSRKQVLQPVVLDVNEVVVQVERMLRRVLPEHIDVRTDLQLDVLHVRADPALLEQMLLNLALNARDAMPGGGRLTLATAGLVDISPAALPPNLPSGRYVRLQVTDTGCGMDAETQARVFEPFFTTKEVGQGTGLGLATVYGIVRASGGGIDVKSTVGQGTTFTIDLPAVTDLSTEAPSTRVGLPSGTETVLLVEDEESVRSLARRVLDRCGYTVLEAPNGKEALLQSDSHAGAIHLVVADVVMPGMSGPELVRRLLPQHPDLRILFISGYAEPAGIDWEGLDRQTLLLEKPFTPAALARRVREVLDAPEGSTS
jgi:signal transduction histidine kinase